MSNLTSVLRFLLENYDDIIYSLKTTYVNIDSYLPFWEICYLDRLPIITKMKDVRFNKIIENKRFEIIPIWSNQKKLTGKYPWRIAYTYSYYHPIKTLTNTQFF